MAMQPRTFQEETNSLINFMAVALVVMAVGTMVRLLTREVLGPSDEKPALLAKTLPKYELCRTPPKFRLTKRVLKDRLYVLQKGIGEHKYFMVVSPRAYRPGYFPRVDLLGEYIPDRDDLFVLDVYGVFSLKYDHAVSGTELQEEMERQGVFRAFYVRRE